MKTKAQQQKEAAATALRKREERERLRVQQEIISGARHPSGLLKTETERWNDLHPDDPR
jgi:hypothetical protein